MRRTITPTEHDIEKAITAFLRVALPNDAVSFHTNGGGFKLSVYELSKLKGAGYISGVPDRCIIWKGQAYFLECKSAKGVLTQSQKEMFPRFEAAGARIAIVRSVDDVHDTLVEWGFPLKVQLLPTGVMTENHRTLDVRRETEAHKRSLMPVHNHGGMDDAEHW